MLAEDIPDRLISEVFEQQLPAHTQYNLDLQQELRDIKERLAALENSLLSDQLVGSDSSSNESPAIQLILSDKAISWKAALRRILVATFGVRTLGKSCAKGKKNSKSEKLDERKLNQIKGNFAAFYYIHNLI